MEAPLHQCGDVSAASLRCYVSRCAVHVRKCTVLGNDGERQVFRIVADHEDWPDRFVQTRHDSVEVHQRRRPVHREPKGNVVAMHRILTAVPIRQSAVQIEPILVGSRLSITWRHRRNAQRYLGQHRRSKDSLRRKERYALTFKNKASHKQVARQFSSVQLRLLLQERKGLQTNPGVQIVCVHGSIKGRLSDYLYHHPACRRSAKPRSSLADRAAEPGALALVDHRGVKHDVLDQQPA